MHNALCFGVLNRTTTFDLTPVGVNTTFIKTNVNKVYARVARTALYYDSMNSSQTPLPTGLLYLAVLTGLEPAISHRDRVVF